jgi:molecular chaperone GrpE
VCDRHDESRGKNETMRKSVPNAEDDLDPAVEGVEDRAVADSPDDLPEEAGGGVAAEAGDARGQPEAAPGAAAAEDASALREELEDLNDRHLRLAAEFNNFRRRTEQERLGAWSRAQADIVGKMLVVLDDLQRVAQLDTSNAAVETIMEGIDLVERKFVRMLEDAGVEVYDPVGEPFDPEVMEAMMRVPADSEDRDETVAQVFEKGYSLKGVLIRPARVSVHVWG